MQSRTHPSSALTYETPTFRHAGFLVARTTNTPPRGIRPFQLKAFRVTAGKLIQSAYTAMSLIPRCRNLVVFATLALTVSFAQQPQRVPPDASKKDEQERIRTVTEEVQLTVTALDGHGRLDPSLEVADVSVLENGVAQEIRSARRVPAHVLVLLDTGGELNSAKRIRLTREIAKELVAGLQGQDEICVMQFHSRIETIQNWTKDKTAIVQALDKKLISGKRARFFAAVIAAASQMQDRPQGNRHVVMVTDGVQTSSEQIDRAAALENLRAANAVVHVISYTSVSRETMQNQRRLTRNRDKSLVPQDALNSIGGEEGQLARRAAQPGGVIFDLDPQRRRQLKKYEEAMRSSEKQLSKIAEESGGRIWLPETFDEMVENGSEAARLIDSQFVVTYKPKRPLSEAREGEIRRVEVVSRRVGLHLVSRRLYVVPTPTE